MQEKLEGLARRFDELTAQMGDPGIYEIPGAFQDIAKEAAKLEPVVKAYRRLKGVREELAGAKGMLTDAVDPEMIEMVRAEIDELTAEEETLTHELRLQLLPTDPNDEKNVVLEIRAGAGGEEAKLFAYDLFRMYQRYAETKGWRIETLDFTASEIGGLKEIFVIVSGEAVYSTLKFESGGHRVQRVPVTESQGRIHTSACTVAVMPEAEEVELEIDPNDLKIERMRARGPGGQSVNTTDSAVRITHVPTGTVVSCQDEKSQHKNMAKAMQVLRTRIYNKMEAEAHAERADMRSNMIGSGDRSDRIRTYNYRENRVTDHRIGLTLYALDSIIDGALDPVIQPVVQAHQAELLSKQSG